MSSVLEDKLLDVLAKTYINKGLPIAKILDNPIFVGLPLEKKVEFLQKYSGKGPAPAIKPSSFLDHIGMGAIGGLAAVSSGMAVAKLPVTIPNVVAGVGVGALLGAISPIIPTVRNFKRDSISHDHLQNNRILSAIAERSMSTSQNVPGVDLSKLVDEARNKSYKVLSENPIQL